MWLLDVATRKLEAFYGKKRPKYAILSHRWENNEVDFDQIMRKPKGSSPAYNKINRCCLEAASRSLKYIWVDTCCIDKRSSAELSEAINSMYKWYAEAEVCFAFLFDVKTKNDLAASSWFGRAWTLQELLAPQKLYFFNRDWNIIACRTDEGDRELISNLTGIPRYALNNFVPNHYSVAQRMSWASARQATREEDIAYSLLGIFEVNMPMLYGEGQRAFARLQEEIIRSSNDLSILAWSGHSGGLLADEPARFKSFKPLLMPEGFALNNAGLTLKLYIQPVDPRCYYRAYLETPKGISELHALLPRATNDKKHAYYHKQISTLLLYRDPENQVFMRVPVPGSSTLGIETHGIDRAAIETARLTQVQIARSVDIMPESDSSLIQGSLSLKANVPFRFSTVEYNGELRYTTAEEHTAHPVPYPDGVSTGFPAYLSVTGQTGHRFTLRLGHDFFFRPCCFILVIPASVADHQIPRWAPFIDTRTSTTAMLSIFHNLEDATATGLAGGGLQQFGEAFEHISAYCGRKASRSSHTIEGLTIDIQPILNGHLFSIWV